jgi:hypothetical protein
LRRARRRPHPRAPGPTVAALVAAERDHQPAGEHAETQPERAHVDERAARDHQAADGDEGDGHHPGGAADEGIEPVDEGAADEPPFQPT